MRGEIVVTVCPAKPMMRWVGLHHVAADRTVTRYLHIHYPHTERRGAGVQITARRSPDSAVEEPILHMHDYIDKEMTAETD
jgi:hypothetical protein